MAVELLSAKAGRIVHVSADYETRAWGLTDQPDFLNICLLVETDLPPLDLLGVIHDIEAISGRQRLVKWGARTLDIDILFYNDEVINSDQLTVPHPLLQERRFVLMPLAEIAPGFMHPVLKKDIRRLLAECHDD